MSFGFSAGDFVAGANLAYKLIRALSETQGATMEYQDAIKELSCIQRTFMHVGQMHASNLFCQATLNAISYTVDSSREVMARFLEKTEKYRRSLSRNGVRTSLARDSWRKIGWSLYKKQELMDLKNTLQTKLMAINILVSTATHRNQYGTPEAYENELIETSHHDTETKPTVVATAVNNSHQEGIACKEPTTNDSSESPVPRVDTMEKNACEETADESVQELSKEERDSRRKLVEEAAFNALVELKMLESPRLSPFLKEKEKEIQPKNEPIKFIDAIGRRYSFPFQICRTWLGMSEFVKQAFVHVEGMALKVEEGCYDLVDPNGAILLPQFWEGLIEPGSRVTMRMWSESEIREKRASEASLEDVPEETLEEMTEDPTEPPEEISNETLQTIPEEISDEISEEIPEESPETLEGRPKEILEENSKPMSNLTGEAIVEEVHKEDSKVTPRETHRETFEEPCPASSETVSESVSQPNSNSDVSESSAQVDRIDSMPKRSFTV